MKEENELLKKAEELNNKKQYNEVITLLPCDTLEKYRNANLYVEKAKAYWNIQQYELCKKTADEALRLNINNAKGHHYLGNIYADLKEYEKAVDEYKEAIKIDPKYVNAHNLLGILYTYLKEYGNAIKHYKNVLEIYPKYVDAYIGLGYIYLQLEEYVKAIEFYKKAIEIDSKNAAAYSGLGSVHDRMKEYEKAMNYCKKATEIDPKNDIWFYNLGIIYYKLKDYTKTKKSFQTYLKLASNKTDFFYENALSKIEEIEKILANHNYKLISNKIDAIKNLLLFKGDCITHYTGISTVKCLLLNASPLRLSEGSFLNDTSEGQELFQFLEINNNTNNRQTEENFTKRPFIGSFVDASKNNDLTLWRMYGKEALEEAKGCSITINAKALKDSINNKISPKFDGNSRTTDDIEFYRVAYRKGDTFDFADSNLETCKNLMELMKELKIEVESFNTKKDKTKKEELEIIELLNEVAYLFKSIEYQYENEIRLVIKEGIGFDKKIDFNPNDFKTSNEPFKVYIELVPILNLLSVITIGPKVNKAEEWAATFHYHLANQNYKPEIHISKLPFK